MEFNVSKGAVFSARPLRKVVTSNFILKPCLAGPMPRTTGIALWLLRQKLAAQHRARKPYTFPFESKLPLFHKFTHTCRLMHAANTKRFELKSPARCLATPSSLRSRFLHLDLASPWCRVWRILLRLFLLQIPLHLLDRVHKRPQICRRKWNR